jgi:hypothetical protein
MEMGDKLFGYTAKEWMLAFLDMLDGSSASYDIKHQTGLNDARCDELSKMFDDATKDGWPK